MRLVLFFQQADKQTFWKFSIILYTQQPKTAI